jgi:Protein of unknown function (DUF1579)
MDLPRLRPVHRRLAALAGRWQGDEVLAPSPWAPGGPARGRHEFRVATGGFTVVHDYAEHRDGRSALTGHGVLCVDPTTEEVLWHWFDSLGFPPAGPSRGGFDDAGRLVLTKATPRGTQRATFAIADDVLTQVLEVRFPEAEDFAVLVEGRYARAAEADPARATAAATASEAAPASAKARRTSIS